MGDQRFPADFSVWGEWIGMVNPFVANRAILIPQAVLAEVAAGSGSDALIRQIEQNPGFLVT